MKKLFVSIILLISVLVVDAQDCPPLRATISPSWGITETSALNFNLRGGYTAQTKPYSILIGVGVYTTEQAVKDKPSTNIVAFSLSTSFAYRVIFNEGKYSLHVTASGYYYETETVYFGNGLRFSVPLNNKAFFIETGYVYNRGSITEIGLYLDL